jgi:SAM-dependent methyltransferase
VKEPQFQLHEDIEDYHWWFLGRRRILGALLQVLLARDATVVDVGCGTGGVIASLDPGYRRFGIDPSLDAIGRARSRFPDVGFQVGRAPNDLVGEARRADAYLLLDVLEHVSDDRALLAGIAGLLGPGGYLIVTVPAGMEHWGPHDEAFGHLRRYTEESLEALFLDLPVDCLLLSFYNRRLLLPARLVRALGQIRGRASGRAGTDFSLPPRMVNRLLTRIFAGEAPRLLRVLQGEARRGYDRGLSLVAVLRRADRGGSGGAP